MILILGLDVFHYQLLPSVQILVSPMTHILNFLPTHVSRIVNKATSRAKCILKRFSSRDSLLLTRAFCTFVRPLLEFSSVIWSSYYKKEINQIEAVQRSFTKAIGNLRFCTYRERLFNLKVKT